MLHCVSCDSGWHVHVYSTILSHKENSLAGGLLSAHSVIKKIVYVLQQVLQNTDTCHFPRHIHVKKKRKAIPVIGRGGPQGCNTLRLPHFLDKLATRQRRGCQPYALAALLAPGRLLVLISVMGGVKLRATVRLERFGQMKNPMTSLGIEPVTFQLVAMCHNQLATT
jgi:hypothetical protein